jgi:hypothetical protein
MWGRLSKTARDFSCHRDRDQNGWIFLHRRPLGPPARTPALGGEPSFTETRPKGGVAPGFLPFVTPA